MNRFDRMVSSLAATMHLPDSLSLSLRSTWGNGLT